MSTITEQKARRLRAACYGDVSDESWAKLKDTWMEPGNFRFLQERSQIPPVCPPGPHWKQWNGHSDAPVGREWTKEVV